ncbi:MAG TPA: AmmeMemoRadiSam system radical SAM enzyme [Thermodesulfobacteriota bacterium]|nr:AmmeMemoRadiSam system radical SAM enzyme [Thermodesulfobacteriota bacterium]HQO78120.1 AmmeMemoRadiSam system radical SAM enzyme [Thermodesulfobacteriota bacterium]
MLDRNVSRRDFLAWTARSACFVCGMGFMHTSSAAAQPLTARAEESHFMREARFYTKLAHGDIECQICPRRCQVSPGDRGFCGNKENRGGVYYTLSYNRVAAAHVDPIEKKPLYHYLPGTRAFSIAAAGCNIRCKFCQNWTIAQQVPEDVEHQPLTVPEAVSRCRHEQCPTVAFTYSEPTAFYSYMYDVAREARAAKVGSVMISNGFIEAEPLTALCRQLTAVKVDLKAFSQQFYSTYCSADLDPVLATLKRLKAIGIWFEIVNLVIPTLNDDPRQIRSMCEWIKANLGPAVPIHFTRFHPMHLIRNLPPTPVKTLELARTIALEAGLHYPYVGNVWGHEGSHTYCPSCKKTLIKRVGFIISENAIVKGACSFCGEPIPGVWRQAQLGLQEESCASGSRSIADVRFAKT